MIVVTTPTGHIGSQLVHRLIDGDESIRVIVRDPSRLDPEVADRVEVISGSHDEPDVLDRALAGADSLFWLVPPSLQIASPEAHYLSFTQAAAEAIRRRGVRRVVAVSSAGHGWSQPAGLLSAAFAMDAEIERTGVAYRSLSMPFFMENLLGQAGPIREQGTFFFPYDADRPLASVATQDIAATAAGLLADHSWGGQENLPVFGPDPLSPNVMAQVISGVLGQSVSYRQVSLEDVRQQLTSWRQRGRGARHDGDDASPRTTGSMTRTRQRRSPVQPTFVPGAKRYCDLPSTQPYNPARATRASRTGSGRLRRRAELSQRSVE